jgi:hypothetical protein
MLDGLLRMRVRKTEYPLLGWKYMYEKVLCIFVEAL